MDLELATSAMSVSEPRRWPGRDTAPPCGEPGSQHIRKQNDPGDGWAAFIEKNHPLFWDCRRRVYAVYSVPMSTLIDLSPLIAAYAVWLLIIWWAY